LLQDSNRNSTQGFGGQEVYGPVETSEALGPSVLKRGGQNLEAQKKVKAKSIQITQQIWSSIYSDGVGYDLCNRPSRKIMPGII
jgi:hypothetical protein